MNKVEQYGKLEKEYQEVKKSFSPLREAYDLMKEGNPSVWDYQDKLMKACDDIAVKQNRLYTEMTPEERQKCAKLYGKS